MLSVGMLSVACRSCATAQQESLCWTCGGCMGHLSTAISDVHHENGIELLLEECHPAEWRVLPCWRAVPPVVFSTSQA